MKHDLRAILCSVEQVSTVGVADQVYEPGVRIPMVIPRSIAESSGEWDLTWSSTTNWDDELQIKVPSSSACRVQGAVGQSCCLDDSLLPQTYS